MLTIVIVVFGLCALAPLAAESVPADVVARD
jgi:hypothetical protein